MTYPHNPGPPPGSWHYPPPMHDSLALGTTLGQLLAGQERQLFLLELTVEELRSLPEKIAALIPPPQPAPPSFVERVTMFREILKLMVPLAILAAIVMGKLTLLEGEGIIRKWLGIG